MVDGVMVTGMEQSSGALGSVTPIQESLAYMPLHRALAEEGSLELRYFPVRSPRELDHLSARTLFCISESLRFCRHEFLPLSEYRAPQASRVEV